MRLTKSIIKRLFQRSEPAPPPPPDPVPEPTPLELVPYYVWKGRENERAILEALAQFGWLTSAQLGMLVWHGYREPQRMAQRTLSRLCRHKAVVRRELDGNMQAYVLAKEGVRRLEDAGIEAVPGTDLRLKWWRHRYAANTFLIDRLLSGRANGIVTEYQLLRESEPTEITPFVRSKDKLPDGIALSTVEVMPEGSYSDLSPPQKVPSRLWLELELSRRRPSDARQLGELIARWNYQSHDQIALVYPIQGRRPEDYARAARSIRAAARAAKLAWQRNDARSPDWLIRYIFPKVQVYLIHFSPQLRFESVVHVSHLGYATWRNAPLEALEHPRESDPWYHLVIHSRES